MIRHHVWPVTHCPILSTRTNQNGAVTRGKFSDMASFFDLFCTKFENFRHILKFRHTLTFRQDHLWHCDLCQSSDRQKLVWHVTSESIMWLQYWINGWFAEAWRNQSAGIYSHACHLQCHINKSSTILKVIACRWHNTVYKSCWMPCRSPLESRT